MLPTMGTWTVSSTCVPVDALGAHTHVMQLLSTVILLLCSGFARTAVSGLMRQQHAALQAVEAQS
jgi:hypothetical protein